MIELNEFQYSLKILSEFVISESTLNVSEIEEER